MSSIYDDNGDAISEISVNIDEIVKPPVGPVTLQIPTLVNKDVHYQDRYFNDVIEEILKEDVSFGQTLLEIGSNTSRDFETSTGGRSTPGFTMRKDEATKRAKNLIKESQHRLAIHIVDIELIFPYLKEKRIIDLQDCEEIKKNRDNTARIEAFIEILLTRGLEGIAFFCKSLEQFYPGLYKSVKSMFEDDNIDIENIIEGKNIRPLSQYFVSENQFIGKKAYEDKQYAHTLFTSLSVPTEKVNMEAKKADEEDLLQKYIKLHKCCLTFEQLLNDQTKHTTVMFNKLYKVYKRSRNDYYTSVETIKKLYDENSELDKKIQNLNLRKEELEAENRRLMNKDADNKDKLNLFRKKYGTNNLGEEVEFLRYKKQVDDTLKRNEELVQCVDSIRREKKDLHDMKEKLLVEKADLEEQVENFKHSTLKSSHSNFDEIDSQTICDSQGYSIISDDADSFTDAMRIIQQGKLDLQKVAKEMIDINTESSIPSIVHNNTPKPSYLRQFKKSSVLSLENREYLSSMLETGIFISTNFNASQLNDSFHPGDRILQINHITQTSNESNKELEFTKRILSQVNGHLLITVAKSSQFILEDYSFELPYGSITRPSSPSDFNSYCAAITPVPSIQAQGYIPSLTRRISTQSALVIPTSFTDANNLHYIESCPNTPLKRSSNLTSSDKSLTMQAAKEQELSSFPEIFRNSEQINPTQRIRPSGIPIFDDDEESLNFKPIKFDAPSPGYAAHPITDTGSVRRTDTTRSTITGKIIYTNMKKLDTMKSSFNRSSDELSLLIKSQTKTEIRSEDFFNSVSVCGGLGYSYFIVAKERAKEFKLTTGQMILRINEHSTESLTYEKFMGLVNHYPMLTLILSNKASHLFHAEISTDKHDHFYVMPKFTTKHVSRKGELFAAPQCVFLVVNTLPNEGKSCVNRFWGAIRIDGRTGKEIDQGYIPSDLWLTYLLELHDQTQDIVIDISDQLSNSYSKGEIFTYDIIPMTNNHDDDDDDDDDSNYELNGKTLPYYYSLEAIDKDSASSELFKCYNIVSREDAPPFPVIIYGYREDGLKEKLSAFNRDRKNTRNLSIILKFICSELDTTTPEVDLLRQYSAGKIIYHRNEDKQSMVMKVDIIRSYQEQGFTCILDLPYNKVVNCSALNQLEPIVIKLRTKFGLHQRENSSSSLNFDDTLTIGLGNDSYVKSLVEMIARHQRYYSWKPMYEI